MRAKLGLSADVDAEFAAALVEELLALLKQNHVDYTSFFRQLSQAREGMPGRCRTRPRIVHRPRRLRRLAVALAGTGSRRRLDGPHQPDLHSA